MRSSQQPHWKIPPMGEIKMMVGGFASRGVTSSQRKAHHLERPLQRSLLSHIPPTKYRSDKSAFVIFIEEADEEGVLFSHDDMPVVTI